MAFLCAASSSRIFFALAVSEHPDGASVFRVSFFADHSGFPHAFQNSGKRGIIHGHAFGNFAGGQKFLFFENRQNQLLNRGYVERGKPLFKAEWAFW